MSANVVPAQGGPNTTMLVVHLDTRDSLQVLCEPRNTSRQQIVRAFQSISGVVRVSAPEEVIRQGTWCLYFPPGVNPSDDVIAEVRRIAKAISARG